MNGSDSISFGREIISNAKVKFTNSTIENESNVLMFCIGFELPGGKTVCTAKFPFSSDKILAILNTIEVRSWEDLPKKYARVAISGNSVTKIGNILNEKWVEVI